MTTRRLFTALAILGTFATALAADPVVSNLTAAQRPGTKLVDITYDLAANTPTVKVTLEVSSDGGTSWSVPVTSATGAVGNGVTLGTRKMITWNAGVDWNGRFTPQTRFRVIADDGLSAPNITFQPGSKSITIGETTTLTVTATGTSPLTYQWYQGQAGVTTNPVGTNSPSYTTPGLTANTTYWARVSNAAGSVNSTIATVTVITPPSIAIHPASTTIASGQTATLSVTANGTPPITYQWYQGSTGTTTTPIGSNNPFFTTPPLLSTTRYWARLTNSAGSVSSSEATVTVTPSTPADLALIPAGSFTMGRTSGDTIVDAPPVMVTLSAFYIGKREVTKGLWDEVRTWGLANGYTDLSTGSGKASNHPVGTLSWLDVVKWCNARSQKEGLTHCYTVSGSAMKTGTTAPTVNWAANGYRLPTEAEWEKAARGGVSGKRFPWGSDTISQADANYFASSSYSYDSSGWVNNYHPTYNDGVSPRTSPVGAFSANGYGLYDVAGNVYEWCWDWYGSSAYVNGATDPRGAASGSFRVLRGGSWQTRAYGCRVADRTGSAEASPFDQAGFRIARSSLQ